MRAKTQPATDQVNAALAWLKKHSTKSTRDGLARYAIPSDNAYGVTVKDIKILAKELGRDHDLALALWDTGVYEARRLSESDDPAARWVGKDALRELTSASVMKRLKR